MKCIIKELGLSENINVTQFCSYANISRTEYYNVINNVKEPKVSLAIKLSSEANHFSNFIEWFHVDELFVDDYIYDLVVKKDIESLKRSAYDNIAKYMELNIDK